MPPSRQCRPLEPHPTHGVSLFLQTIQGQREQSREMAMRGERIAGDFKCGDVRQNDIQGGHSVRLSSTAFARIAIAGTIRVSEQPRTIMGLEVELPQRRRALWSARSDGSMECHGPRHPRCAIPQETQAIPQRSPAVGAVHRTPSEAHSGPGAISLDEATNSPHPACSDAVAPCARKRSRSTIQSPRTFG